MESGSDIQSADKRRLCCIRYQHLLLLLILLFILQPGEGQDNRIVFSNLSVNRGLSDNFIKCIYRDTDGFIWLGTNSGLNRFDGYDFEIFRSLPSDSTTISDNSVNVITGDSIGNLWIGTRTGISVLDNETFRFRRIYLESPPRHSCQDINYITAMSSDHKGNFLAGTHNGVFYINSSDGSVKHKLFDEKACSSPLNNVTSIACDKTGAFWIGTVNGFIINYREGSGSFGKFEPLKGKDQIAAGAIRLFIDEHNYIWVADRNGLNIYDIENKKWNEDFHQKHSRIFENLEVTGIDQDTEGTIWLSTDGHGAYLIKDPETGPVSITSLPYSEGSLSSNGLTSLLCDESGITWLGNSKKGVDFYKRNITKFRLFRNYPFTSNSISNNDVNCVTEDYRGDLWIGTNGGGLDRYNPKTGTFTHYTTENSNLSSNIIVSVFEDSEHLIWTGTYMGGLNCIDPETGALRVYRFNASDSASISDNRVWSIGEDSRKNLWVATLTGGLNLFIRETGKFRRYNTGNSSICFDYINHISFDDKDNLWLSSANGLIFFDPRNNRSECWYSNPGTNGSLSDNHIISTFEDSRGFFWVCTNNGLNLMDREKKSFRAFGETDGLPSNSVLRILEDDDANLWISTKNGISKLIVEIRANDSISFNFVNYGMSDGLQGKEFNETAAYKSSTGELLFGGSDGLNAFQPSEIEKESSLPKLVLTGLRIDNIAIKCGENINNRILLEKPLFHTEKITLKYRENSFTIDFAALNFFFPERTRYAYNLEGFSGKWITTGGNENYATFSNLDNGNYVFRLKGTNTDGIWNEVPVSLRIRILPPFWKTWFAYLIYVIIILSLLILLRHLTLTSERLRMQIEREQVESQHLHEIDSLKIRFFTNISHEFRTPLSLILSPAEKLRSVVKDKPEEKQVNLIIRNARRLLFMVNELLDFRKMEVQGFGFNPSPGNIVGFIRNAVASFDDLAEQKHIDLVFEPEKDEIMAFFDRDKIEKIIYNLLSNSFKFTQADGRINVSISQTPGSVIIRISDTGIGVLAEKSGRLFESFYQVDSGISADQGTGLGLSLVKEFVSLHDGEISMESEPGKGTSFTIQLPIKDRRVPADESTSMMKGAEIAIPEKSAVELKGGKSTVLVAEDDDDLRFYLKDNLKDRYNMYEAANGREALAIIKKIVPDLIISDIMMPGIDGLELCRQVRSDKNISHIPIILLTAIAREEKQFESLETGADDCIMKPFNFQLLEARISNLITSRRNLRKTFRTGVPIEPREIEIRSLDDQFIQKALDLVEKNMSKTDYTVEELSNDLGLSRTLLYKKILTITGKPPNEFIRLLRLKRAAQLLQKSQLNVSEVAFRVGFNDPKYFRKHFKNEFGMLPSAYSEKFSKES